MCFNYDVQRWSAEEARSQTKRWEMRGFTWNPCPPTRLRQRRGYGCQGFKCINEERWAITGERGGRLGAYGGIVLI
ncbi:hypothetical protein Naga_100513g2 [Nannochloropsis gaditana]|uniref:Uncharacterized protein n=1 Tax=Nannochloropsis gaditana TaxID=72520 RepID=W7TWM3_9STRA|nr:hypothetical protein Naga_100513g2 [Nannochloropsis gaditana]